MTIEGRVISGEDKFVTDIQGHVADAIACPTDSMLATELSFESLVSGDGLGHRSIRIEDQTSSGAYGGGIVEVSGVLIGMADAAIVATDGDTTSYSPVMTDGKLGHQVGIRRNGKVTVSIFSPDMESQTVLEFEHRI